MKKFIESTQNPIIKNAEKLKNPKARKLEKHTLVEGRREIMLAIRGGVLIDTLFYNTDYGRDIFDPKTIPATSTIVRLSKKAFDKLSIRENPDGLIAIVNIPEKNLKNLRIGSESLVLVLESIEKPGNLGAILRTADAAGVDAVIIADPRTDVYQPNAIRASQGTVFTSQIAIASSKNALEWLQKNNFSIFAATPNAQKNYAETDYSGRIAVVVGSEDVGLTDLWLKSATQKIKIPMRGKIDSLNVSVSVAVIVFEALRQRQIKTRTCE